MCIQYAYYNSPIGLLEIKSTEEKLLGIQFVDTITDYSKKNCAIATLCIQQLDLYFHQQLEKFTLPIEYPSDSSNFAINVWNALLTIPYGTTYSYKELAEKIGQPSSARAIGNACRKNPFVIVIPSHRVICHNGKLGGYIGGIEVKKQLVYNEKKG